MLATSTNATITKNFHFYLNIQRTQKPNLEC